MKTIVLLVRKNNKIATHVSVCLYGNFVEAQLFCNLINNLSLENSEKLVAKTVVMNMEYTLDKWEELSFDDLINADDRMIQRTMREIDSKLLAISLINAKQELSDRFFRNMSKRSASMLMEDIEYIGPVDDIEIEIARQKILNIYSSLIADRFDTLTATCEKNKKKEKKEKLETIEERDNIVLIFRGSNDIVQSVTVSLFDSYERADDFCNYLNELKTDKNNFLYAKHAEQVIEYETRQPILIQFDRIFDIEKLYGKYQTTRIFREALKKFSDDTLLAAFIGLDKISRERIMQCLPIKTADSINSVIDTSDNNIFTLNETRNARLKLVNAINRTVERYIQEGKNPANAILKD